MITLISVGCACRLFCNHYCKKRKMRMKLQFPRKIWNKFITIFLHDLSLSNDVFFSFNPLLILHIAVEMLAFIWYLERKVRPNGVYDDTEQMWRHIAPQWFMGASWCFMWYRLVWLNPSIKPVLWTKRLISVPLIPRRTETFWRLTDNLYWTCACDVRLCPSDVLQRNSETKTMWTMHQGDLWKLYEANSRERVAYKMAEHGWRTI